MAISTTTQNISPNSIDHYPKVLDSEQQILFRNLRF